MKKRIDTLMYDTETAKKLGDWYSDCSRNDFNYWHEALYKKRTGEYFLYGEGGPSSKYAEQAYGDQNAMTGGEDITPLTFNEARKWYEGANNNDDECAPDEVYKHEFEPVGSKDDTVDTYSMRLHKSAKIKLQKMAQKQGISQSEVIENLIMNN